MEPVQWMGKVVYFYVSGIQVVCPNYDSLCRSTTRINKKALQTTHIRALGGSKTEGSGGPMGEYVQRAWGPGGPGYVQKWGSLVASLYHIPWYTFDVPTPAPTKWQTPIINALWSSHRPINKILNQFQQNLYISLSLSILFSVKWTYLEISCRDELQRVWIENESNFEN